MGKRKFKHVYCEASPSKRKEPEWGPVPLCVRRVRRRLDFDQTRKEEAPSAVDEIKVGIQTVDSSMNLNFEMSLRPNTAKLEEKMEDIEEDTEPPPSWMPSVKDLGASDKSDAATNKSEDLTEEVDDDLDILPIDVKDLDERDLDIPPPPEDGYLYVLQKLWVHVDSELQPLRIAVWDRMTEDPPEVTGAIDSMGKMPNTNCKIEPKSMEEIPGVGKKEVEKECTRVGTIDSREKDLNDLLTLLSELEELSPKSAQDNAEDSDVTQDYDEESNVTGRFLSAQVHPEVSDVTESFSAAQDHIEDSNVTRSFSTSSLTTSIPCCPSSPLELSSNNDFVEPDSSRNNAITEEADSKECCAKSKVDSCTSSIFDDFSIPKTVTGPLKVFVSDEKPAIPARTLRTARSRDSSTPDSGFGDQSRSPSRSNSNSDDGSTESSQTNSVANDPEPVDNDFIDEEDDDFDDFAAEKAEAIKDPNFLAFTAEITSQSVIERLKLAKIEGRHMRCRACIKLRKLPKKYGTIATFVRHVRQKHEDIERPKCKVCFKTFARNDQLSRHTRTLHEKPMLIAQEVDFREFKKEEPMRRPVNVEKCRKNRAFNQS